MALAQQWQLAARAAAEVAEWLEVAQLVAELLLLQVRALRGFPAAVVAEVAVEDTAGGKEEGMRRRMRRAQCWSEVEKRGMRTAAKVRGKQQAIDGAAQCWPRRPLMPVLPLREVVYAELCRLESILVMVETPPGKECGERKTRTSFAGMPRPGTGRYRLRFRPQGHLPAHKAKQRS